MDYLAILQAAIKYGPAVKSVIDEALTNQQVVAGIKATSSVLAGLLESAGSAFFPNAKAEFHVAAAAMAAFDPDVTKWVQGALNILNTPSPNLKVDGLYGLMTKAAVEAFQTAHGMSVDGWAGQLTQALIGQLLSHGK